MPVLHQPVKYNACGVFVSCYIRVESISKKKKTLPFSFSFGYFTFHLFSNMKTLTIPS